MEGDASFQVGETSDRGWKTIIKTRKGRRRTIPDVPEDELISSHSFSNIELLCHLKEKLPVWDGDRFDGVYEKMLRYIILKIVRLERRGISTGNLGDDNIQLIFGEHWEDQTTQVLLDTGGNAHNLRHQFIGLVERLSQGVEEIPKELIHFLELIKSELSWKQFEQLVYHPWLMPLEERFFFLADCLVQLKSKLKDWKQKLTERTPTGYDWISEVAEMDDCFKQIYNSPLRTQAYENNYVGALVFCKNVILHIGNELENGEWVEKCVHDFLCKHFPDLMLELFNFFFENNLSLDFKIADKERSETLAKTLFAGNLSFKIKRSDVDDFFKEVGRVVDVSFPLNQEGRWRGYGLVEFATADEAQEALELDGSDLVGRPVRLERARGRGAERAYTPHSSRESNSYQRGRGRGHVCRGGWDSGGWRQRP